MQGVTIADVARRAGVSGMTISRVLSSAAPVNAATQERVRRAVRELDYRPNAAARHLASGSAHRLDFIYASPSQAYLSELLVGALDECASHGCQLVLARASDPARRRRELRARCSPTASVPSSCRPPSATIRDCSRCSGARRRAGSRSRPPSRPRTRRASQSMTSRRRTP
jgi:LacI family transcriptional regulator